MRFIELTALDDRREMVSVYSITRFFLSRGDEKATAIDLIGNKGLRLFKETPAQIHELIKEATK